MRHYFPDTNVLLDYLAERPPFWADAAELMQTGVDGQTTLYVASLSFSNAYYVLRKQTNPERARALIAKLEKLVTIVPVDAAIVRQAITGPFPDFEDGLQHYAAASVPAIEAIITRNLRDFTNSTLPTLTPERALLDLSRP